MKIISITANIAAGKTTIINALKQKLNDEYVFVEEPVDEWTKHLCENGKNIFENFYNDPKEWAYPFQLYVYATRMAMLENAIKNNPNCKFVILERSPDDDRFIFSQILYEKGFISYDQLNCIDSARSLWTNKYKPMIDKILHINTREEICLERLNKRARQGEEDKIPLEYLQAIKKKTIVWLEKEKYVVTVLNDTGMPSYEFDEMIEILIKEINK